MTKQLKDTAFKMAPVVALHSSASNSSQWKLLVEHLQDWHDVIAIDLPGYGSGPQRDNTVSGMQSVAAPVISEIEKLQTPVHLVGHSFGGAVVLKIALLRPDLVKSITLYEPAAFGLLKFSVPSDQNLLTDIRIIQQLIDAPKSIERQDLGMEKFVNFWNGPNAWQKLPEQLCEKLGTFAPQVSSDIQCAFTEDWKPSDLSVVSIPTLMIMGMESPKIAQRTASLIVENIPTAELAILPGLGHMAPIQDPDWVNPRIRQHISRVERSASRVSWPNRAAA